MDFKIIWPQDFEHHERKILFLSAILIKDFMTLWYDFVIALEFAPGRLKILRLSWFCAL